MTSRATAAVTVTAALTSAGALGYAELALPAQPLLSDYALVPGGMPPTLLGMLALAVACVSLSYGMVSSDPRGTAATRVLLLAAAAGLMLSAIFPTDPAAAELKSLTGEIHRWSAAVVFTTLPVAGWTLARGRAGLARWSAVRALAVTSALVLAVYLAAHPASITSGWIGGAGYYGLLERALVVADMVLLMVMAAATTRPSAVAVPAVEPAAEKRHERLAA
ncbi:DUF998 domain-containing protein [Nonomuraea sp. NPDC048826]|uniref:DUF998 domain-containing protein n=1 Tax=Nonomuraea sp. NPDC048826 TaxID=3364347 RepID=UPI00371E6594